jgi:hypothetical protein
VITLDLPNIGDESGYKGIITTAAKKYHTKTVEQGKKASMVFLMNPTSGVQVVAYKTSGTISIFFMPPSLIFSLLIICFTPSTLF